MGMTMTAEAVEARKIYQREYRRRNRDKINSQRRKWQSENREKAREYNQRYWQKKTRICVLPLQNLELMKQS